MPVRKIAGPRRSLALVVLTAVITGCASIGPSTMDRDQLDYGNSVGNNWKNQMVANLVRLRYLDMPVFVDVGQIVSGYSLETLVRAEAGFGSSFVGGDAQGVGATGRYTDRPTITYMPKTGEDYLRSLLEPVEPRALLSLILAGYDSELLLTWAVEGINGMLNYSVSGQVARPADPEFVEFVRILRKLQQNGAISFELENDPKTGHDILLTFDRKELDEEELAMRERTGELTGLSTEHDRYRIIYSPYSTEDDVLAIQTRSIIQMLGAMSGFVDVPPEKASHAASGYSFASGVKRPFHVLSGPDRPDSSFAEFKYQGYWYWIENSDLTSKRVFTLMLFLTTLTNTGSSGREPVLTIPTG